MTRLRISTEAAIALIDGYMEAESCRAVDPWAESVTWEAEAVKMRANAEYARDVYAKAAYLRRAKGYESLAKQSSTPLPHVDVICDPEARQRAQATLSAALSVLDCATAYSAGNAASEARERDERASAEAMFSGMRLLDSPSACRVTSDGYVHAETSCGHALTILSADGDTWITRIDGRELRYCTAAGDRLAREAVDRARGDSE